jgi:hypothetical protein
MPRLMTFLLASILIPVPATSFAQQTQSPAKNASPCSQSEARQFDFWIGEWVLEWGDGNRGRNVIRKALDGCVIEENFDGTPAIPLRGMSVSTYNAGLKKWQQTWVDNQGGYLDFRGEFKDSKMVLERKARLNGREVLQRMVWYDIAGDGLYWNWERSEDEGRTWKVLWKIKYTRKK